MRRQFFFTLGILLSIVACSYTPAAPPAAPPTAPAIPTRNAEATSAPLVRATTTMIPLTRAVTRIAMPEPTDTPASFKAFTASTPEPTAFPTQILLPRVRLGQGQLNVEYRAEAKDLAVSANGNAFAWTRSDWANEQQKVIYTDAIFVPSYNLLEQRPLDANQPIVLAVEAAQERIITGAADGAIEIWNARTGARDFLYGQVNGMPMSIVLNHDETLLAVGAHGRFQGGDGSVTLWKKEDAHAVKILPTYGAVTRVAFAADDTLYFSTNASSCARGGGGVFAWNGVSAEAKEVFSANGNSIIDFAIHPQGKIVASVGQTRASRCTGAATVSIWDVSSGKALRVLSQSELSDAVGVAFSPDGKLLAVGDAWGNLTVWDWEMNKMRQNWEISTSALERVFWLANHTLLLDDQDGYVRLYQISP